MSSRDIAALAPVANAGAQARLPQPPPAVEMGQQVTAQQVNDADYQYHARKRAHAAGEHVTAAEVDEARQVKGTTRAERAQQRDPHASAPGVQAAVAVEVANAIGAAVAAVNAAAAAVGQAVQEAVGTAVQEALQAALAAEGFPAMVRFRVVYVAVITQQCTWTLLDSQVGWRTAIRCARLRVNDP